MKTNDADSKKTAGVKSKNTSLKVVSNYFKTKDKFFKIF